MSTASQTHSQVLVRMAVREKSRTSHRATSTPEDACGPSRSTAWTRNTLPLLLSSIMNEVRKAEACL